MRNTETRFFRIIPFSQLIVTSSNPISFRVFYSLYSVLLDPYTHTHTTIGPKMKGTTTRTTDAFATQTLPIQGANVAKENLKKSKKYHRNDSTSVRGTAQRHTRRVTLSAAHPPVVYRDIRLCGVPGSRGRRSRGCCERTLRGSKKTFCRILPSQSQPSTRTYVRVDTA